MASGTRPPSATPPPTPSALAFVAGVRETREIFQAWRRRPGPVLRAWTLGSLVAALGMLGAILLVAALSSDPPDQVGGPPFLPGQAGDAAAIFGRNLLVLALHAMACVAGFIAGSSLPLQAGRRRGLSRRLHDQIGRFAIVFVSAATLYSLVRQALVVGHQMAAFAAGLHTPRR